MHMYEWDRDLLHRALDLQLDAMKKGVVLEFGFPRPMSGYSSSVFLYCPIKDPMAQIADTNEELKEVLEDIGELIGREEPINDIPEADHDDSGTGQNGVHH